MSTSTPIPPEASIENQRRAGPWVDDEDRSHLEPLAPVSDHDDRPAVRDLIQQHAVEINKVRDNLSEDPLYDSVKHDDLWILRFLLSHESSTDRAIAAARGALSYRKRKQLDERDIRNQWPDKKCDHLKPVQTYLNCIDEGGLIFSVPHCDRGVVGWVVLAALDQEELLRRLTQEEWPYWYFAEWTFQVTDSITRRTGRLTQSVRMVDCEGASVARFHRECLLRDVRASIEYEDFYPQLLKAMYVINAPSFITSTFRLFRSIMPQRFVEKFDFIDPANNAEDATLLLKHMSIDHIPKKYGGNFQHSSYPNQILTREGSA